MKLTYNISNQEMKDILSKVLDTPVNEVYADTDGNFIVKTNHWKLNIHHHEKTILDDNHITNEIKKDFLNKFGEQKTDEILNFFKQFFDGLKEMTHPDFIPDSIFFYKKENGLKKIWMQQDSKNGTLWCKWRGLWSFFENEINLNYNETQYVVKTMVEQHLKREVGTPINTKTHFA